MASDVGTADREAGTRPSASAGTRAVDRAFDVLSCFTTGPMDRGVSEIAEAAGLSTSTAHRLARSLVDRGYLMQPSPSGRYRLGPSAVILGRIAQRAFGIDEAMPMLQELAKETGESVNLGIREAGHAVVLVHVPSRQSLRFEQPPGTVVRLHASSIGKCLLAWTQPETNLAELALDRLTPATITTVARLRTELAAVREQGYSVDREEAVLGVRCVGAPIAGGGATPLAALAVQGPSVRFPDERIPELAVAARGTAERISLALEKVIV